MLALRRTLPTVSRRVSRCMSTEASSGSMTLNFSLPHETIYSEAKVSQVIVPGAAGEYGITADHVPIVAQLKPGVLQIMHEGAEPEKYFVAGGFSLTHDNSVTVRLVVAWVFPPYIFLFHSPYFSYCDKFLEYNNGSSDPSSEPSCTLDQPLTKTFSFAFSSLRLPKPTQDISCPEAVKLDDIDPVAVTSNYEAAKSAFSSAEAGSVAAAEAQIDVEVNRAMGAAIGLSLN